MNPWAPREPAASKNPKARRKLLEPGGIRRRRKKPTKLANLQESSASEVFPSDQPSTPAQAIKPERDACPLDVGCPRNVMEPYTEVL